MLDREDVSHERHHSQDRHRGRRNPYGDGTDDRAADTARGGDRRDRKSLCRQICRGPLAADRDRRGARRAAVEARGGRARHRRRQGAELRQGRGRRRERRARACGRDPASQDGRAGAQGAEQGRGADPVVEEAQRPRHDAGHSARPQGRGLRAQPFRRHGSADQRRAARQRDHGRGRRHRQRPAAAAGRRADGCGSQGRRRFGRYVQKWKADHEDINSGG